jgi:hypothetical protein
MTSSKEDLQKSLDRINSIFAGIVDYAEESSLLRCPYRDMNDFCTALFSCRNQVTVRDESDSFSCGHDGSFDYRPAWESNPRNWEKMQGETVRIRNEALKNRRNNN